MHVWGQFELHLPVSSVPPSQGPARGTGSHFYDLGQNVLPSQAAQSLSSRAIQDQRGTQGSRPPSPCLPTQTLGGPVVWQGCKEPRGLIQLYLPGLVFQPDKGLVQPFWRAVEELLKKP